MRASELKELLDAARPAARARCPRILVEEGGETARGLRGVLCAEIKEYG